MQYPAQHFENSKVEPYTLKLKNVNYGNNFGTLFSTLTECHQTHEQDLATIFFKRATQ